MYTILSQFLTYFTKYIGIGNDNGEKVKVIALLMIKGDFENINCNVENCNHYIALVFQ